MEVLPVNDLPVSVPIFGQLISPRGFETTIKQEPPERVVPLGQLVDGVVVFVIVQLLPLSTPLEHPYIGVAA